MLTEVRGDNGGTPTVTPKPASGRPAWWVRLLGRVPLAVGTGRFSSVERARRWSSARLTRIGTWRSAREILALF